MGQYTDTDGTYLVVILEDRPKAGLYPGDAPVELVLEGKLYRDAGYGDSLGLYDWLRDECDLVVGIALTLLDETAPAVRSWPPVPYVRRAAGQDYVEIMLRGYAGETFTRSEQITSTSRMLVADGNEYALVFDAVGLTASDRKVLSAETPLALSPSAG